MARDMKTNRPKSYGKKGPFKGPFSKGFKDSETRSNRPFRKDGESSSRPSTRRNDETSERKTYRPFRKDGEATSRPAPKRNNAFQRRTTAPKPALRGSVLWGIHAVAQAWLNPARTCFALRATDSGLAALRDALAKAEKLGLARPAPLRVERADIDVLVSKGTVHQGLLLEAEPLTEISFDDILGRNEAAQLIVVLDQVTDPHNVGAVLRSAAALGAAAVLVTERHAPQATGVLAKTASGALEHVPVVCVVNMARTLDTLKDENFWCVGLAEEGTKTLDACALSSGKIALVLGAEGEGLRRLTRERCDELAKLPTQGPIGSLNVSNAAAIALYEVARQRLTTGG